MAVYFEEHTPVRRQWQARKGDPTGAVLLHTAENNTDLILPDTGAEGVANFIKIRTNVGSYHLVADSDSWMQLGRYEWMMYGTRGGYNEQVVHLSWACQASQWATLPKWWVDGAMVHGVAAARHFARWMESEHNIVVPGEFITPEEIKRGRPGFSFHSETDPDRRTDPGSSFPWGEFQKLYNQDNAEDVPDQLDRMASRLWDIEALVFIEWAIRFHHGRTPDRPEIIDWLGQAREEGLAPIRWRIANG